MKSLRKSILTLLALTLFGGAGAWAQGPTQVTQFTTDLLPASWASDNSDLTLADLQALGFEAVDASVAQAWTGAPQGEFVVLIYGFNGGNFNYITFDESGAVGTPSYTGYSKKGFYENVAHSIKHFYTGSPEPAEIELTKSGANQWSLGQTPDYDLELQVEYYQKHALKNIPEGWTVMVNGVAQTKPYQGDSLLITETDSVTLVPTDPLRVKSVTLEEDGPAVQTVNIDGIELQIAEGETWEQIIARNSGVIRNFNGFVESDEGMLYMDEDFVSTSDTYTPPAENYDWEL